MAIYKSGGYTRKGVVYEGPTRPRGRPSKAIVVMSTKPKKAKLSKPIKKAVTAMIKSTEEIKWAPNSTLADQKLIFGSGLNYDGVTFFNGWVSVVPGLIPSILQGTNETNRIGNKIRPVSFKVKYTLSANTTNDGLNNPFRGVPFLVRVFIYRHRYAIDDASQDQILQAGSTSIPFGNTPDKWLNPYNKDKYRVCYSKQFLMCANRHQIGTNASNVVPESMPNNAKSFVTGSISIPLPKTLIFNDASAVPTNAGWYMAVTLCNQDGVAVTGLETRCTLNAESYLSFTDA